MGALEIACEFGSLANKSSDNVRIRHAARLALGAENYRGTEGALAT